MLQVVFYSAICIIGSALTFVLWNRNKTYHGFMVRQSNFWDEEYDRIYSSV